MNSDPHSPWPTPGKAKSLTGGHSRRAGGLGEATSVRHRAAGSPLAPPGQPSAGPPRCPGEPGPCPGCAGGQRPAAESRHQARGSRARVSGARWGEGEGTADHSAPARLKEPAVSLTPRDAHCAVGPPRLRERRGSWRRTRQNFPSGLACREQMHIGRQFSGSPERGDLCDDAVTLGRSVGEKTGFASQLDYLLIVGPGQTCFHVYK